MTYLSYFVTNKMNKKILSYTRKKKYSQNSISYWSHWIYLSFFYFSFEFIQITKLFKNNSIVNIYLK